MRARLTRVIREVVHSDSILVIRASGQKEEGPVRGMDRVFGEARRFLVEDRGFGNRRLAVVGNLAASGVGDPGAQFAHGGFDMRLRRNGVVHVLVLMSSE